MARNEFNERVSPGRKTSNLYRTSGASPPGSISNPSFAPALSDSDIQDITPNSSLKNESDEWLTTTEAAAYLKVGKRSLLNMTSNGKVPYCKLGRRNRYNKSELRRLLLDGKRGSYGN
jgi:excisionase family DNA binding protein